MPSTQRSTSPPPAGAPARGRIGGLDGLRAIAVAVVLVYHLLPGLLPGGMVGVDAFFVISGFLITSLLLVERRTTGRIDVMRFWTRRLRRIVPALLVAVAATVAAAACLGGDVLLAVRRQVIGSVLLVYNWVEIVAGSSYFDQTQPLLLTNVWSLAVEEQFYLVWPLVIIVLLARGVSRQRVRVGALLALVLSLASAVWALRLVRDGAPVSRVYMGTDTHAFGLMLGAAWALWHGRATQGDLEPLPAGLRRVRGAAGWAGLAGLLILARVAGETAADGGSGPEPALIIASVCTLAVVQALTGEVAGADGPARRLMSLLEARPLKWLGERSYGLYLWHWPLGVLAFYAIPPTVSPWVVAVGVLGLTLCTAELSYALIETPVRRDGLLARLRGLVRLRPRQLVPAGGGATALVLLLVLAFASQPAQSAAQQAIAIGTGHLSAPSAAPAPAATAAPAQSAPEPSAAPFTGGEVVVVGDSVTIAAAPSLEADLPGVAVNAEVSRSVYAALPALQAMDAGGARPCVVVALATNGSVETDQLDAILSYLGPDRRLVLVTAYGPARTTWIPPANETIRAFAQAHPDQVAVADWDAVVAARPDLLVDDQVHPVPEGAQLYAQTVTNAVESLRRQPAS
ncbi:lipopolysaccharide modification acyltransferase [Actinomyces sp. oral taxon 414]|uniref:acyltransferase family protein n=1 Tax=Actinomyces sp. oral taxon 414 TaxID=712122 RepID=UPI0006ADD303|nr:acyltransferase family protein [Actinomyces sp. oral taxon 414]ALC98699.1 lipopolysaccharide modification acyltransferase [Actinomyces sp. oral taxon 414]